MTAYPSDMTDVEWKILRKEVPKARRGGRKRTVDVREILNAIFYVLDNGIKWISRYRRLAKDFKDLEELSKIGFFSL